MDTIDWYFDFISPYAYLQSTRLAQFEAHAKLRLKPVLFAGLLEHFEQKGPAEVLPKRQWTYESVAWLAHQYHIALKWPPSHPFVPLRLLRLSIALGNTPAVVHDLFEFVWRRGQLPTDDDAWQDLLTRHGIDEAQVQTSEVKQQLRRNTREAIERGVFGVPTLVAGEQRFWGFESTPMAVAWLRGDRFFDSPVWHGARSVAMGVQR